MFHVNEEKYVVYYEFRIQNAQTWEILLFTYNFLFYNNFCILYAIYVLSQFFVVRY